VTEGLPAPGSEPFSPLVERALRRAAHSHQGQVRKGSDVPYITHPFAVALLLERFGFRDESLLAAALLHDVVEDTDADDVALRQEFPEEVVVLVGHLTERKRDEAGRLRPWSDRKQEHLAEVRTAPLSARAIVLADKLHNLATMLYDLDAGTELWSRFRVPPRQLVQYHRAMVEAACGSDDRLLPLADACRGLLEALDRRLPRDATGADVTEA
jgi:(p)ppGpp synthase/HD superfamily hydrolase